MLFGKLSIECDVIFFFLVRRENQIQMKDFKDHKSNSTIDYSLLN